MKTPNFWEDTFSDYESGLAVPYSAFLEKCNHSNESEIIITDKDKRMFSDMMRIQSLRTREAMNGMTAIISRTLDSVISEVLGPTAQLALYGERFPFYLDKEGFSKDRYIKNIFNDAANLEYYKIIKDRVWAIGHLSDDSTGLIFCTSDNPVIYFNSLTGDIRLGHATLDKKGSLLIFPLDKHNILIIFPRDDAYFDAGDDPNMLDNRVFNILDAEQANFLNWLVYINSFSQIYFDESSNADVIIGGIRSMHEKKSRPRE